MKLISQFEKNGSTFAEDDEGNIYELRLVKSVTQKNDDIQLKRKIVNMLQELQVPTNYSGYKLLIDCLYFSIKYEECRKCLSETLYPKVAISHNMKSNSVPCAIDALACRWGRTKDYQKLFGSKTVAAKKMIIGLTNYYLTQNKVEL